MSLEQVKAALSSVPFLHTGLHQAIHSALNSAGLLKDDSAAPVLASSSAQGTIMDKLEAASANPPTHVRTAMILAQGIARRWQIDLDCGIDKLNLQLSARGVPTSERLQLKDALATARAID